jgi:hypothetical protein
LHYVLGIAQRAKHPVCEAQQSTAFRLKVVKALIALRRSMIRSRTTAALCH